MKWSEEKINESEEEDSDESDSSHETLKRKNISESHGNFKKVKYEDITDEKPKKKSKNDLYKPPTVEELKELKETESLYNNNLFRLQIEELIKEVQVKDEYQEIFDKWLEKFKKLIKKLPEFDDITISSIKRVNKKKLDSKQNFINNLIKNDSISIKCDQDLTLKFTPPTDIELFGLQRFQALPGPQLRMKINVKIPAGYLHQKDYLNNRYFVRRYYYLLYLSGVLENINWKLYDNSGLMPFIEIKLNEDVTVEIYATPANSIFKLSRFSPEINNVKGNVYDGVDLKDNEELKNIGTPFYNSLLARDLTLSSNLLNDDTILKDLTNVQEGIKLIHIWLSQRFLNCGVGALTDDLLKYLIIYLVSKKKLINKHMSSYQVVRNFWNFIRETDLLENPIYICDEISYLTLENFKKSFDIVFLDKTGCYNIAAFFDKQHYLKLKSECDLAFKLIDSDGFNSFHSLFISKLHPELQYDAILTLHSDKNFNNLYKLINFEDKVKFLGNINALLYQRIYSVLKRGLNKRATLIVPLFHHTDKDLNQIQFGINLDQLEAFNFLEIGPDLTDPQEKDFREFWGSLSSDRRFKDGTVCVAVYFETETIKDKRGIIRKIIDWVVREKLKLDYTLNYDEFEDLIVNKKVNGSFPMGTNEECCLKAIAAADDLGKKLRNLKLPLSITGIQTISDVYCFTEVFPPIPTNYRPVKKVTAISDSNLILNDNGKLKVLPKYVYPLESVLQLEHSSKWYRDLEGVRNMKTAFYIQIAKNLLTQHKILSSVKAEYLDIFYDGLVFRYLLHVPREIGLLKKETTSNGLTVYKDTVESMEIEKKLDILPKIVGALKGIQSQFPSYGPSTALIKRWMRSQLIDNSLFPDTVVNLLNAAVYTNQSSYLVPCTPQIGFLRFLKFFSESQYDIQAVIVNFNEEISKQTLAEIDSKLLQNRESYPNLFIVTPYDNCESLFTKTVPTREVLRRVKHLATETLNVIQYLFAKQQIISPKQLFLPNLNGYNVLIHLRPLLNPLRHEQVISDELEGAIHYESYDKTVEQKIPVIDFNPVQLYLKELRQNYGEYANFFHDSYGGNVIGVLWIPKALEAKEFKISNMNGRKLENNKLVLNIDGLIEDFYILGKGLVKTIEKR